MIHNKYKRKYTFWYLEVNMFFFFESSQTVPRRWRRMSAPVSDVPYVHHHSHPKSPIMQVMPDRRAKPVSEINLYGNFY